MSDLQLPNPGHDRKFTIEEVKRRSDRTGDFDVVLRNAQNFELRRKTAYSPTPTEFWETANDLIKEQLAADEYVGEYTFEEKIV